MAFQKHPWKFAIVPVGLSTLLTVSACQSPTPPSVETPSSPGEITTPVMSDVPSPDGGLVKQVTIPGPESAVLVTCDQAGFEPFFYSDQGNWVGCQISEGAQPGAPSSLTEPYLEEVSSPVGGMVKQVTIPGPESAVMVACGQAGFEPFFYSDQGNWVGCQGS